MNHTLVTRSLSFDKALAFAETAERLTDELADLYAEARRDSQRIAATHQRLGVALKLAEVHAVLAVAEAVDRVYSTKAALALQAEGAQR